jgi:hypothetical protein
VCIEGASPGIENCLAATVLPCETGWRTAILLNLAELKVKAATLRAAVPAALTPGVRLCRADPALQASTMTDITEISSLRQLDGESLGQ